MYRFRCARSGFNLISVRTDSGRAEHVPIFTERYMYRFWRAVHVPIFAARYMYHFRLSWPRGTCTDFARAVHVPILAARYMY